MVREEELGGRRGPWGGGVLRETLGAACPLGGGTEVSQALRSLSLTWLSLHRALGAQLDLTWSTSLPPPPPELFVTEASHLRTLRVLDLVFYQRLRREGHLSREELALLFPNLPELIEIHSKAAPPPLGSGGPTGCSCQET